MVIETNNSNVSLQSINWGGRVAAALPDAITCGFFISAWMVPFVLNTELVRNLISVIFLELFVLHASGMFGFVVYGHMRPKLRIILLFTLSSFYIVLVGTWAWIDKEWWLFGAFIWLLLSRFGMVIFDSLPDDKEFNRQISLWGLSFVIFLVVVVITTNLPIPQLGLSRDVIPSLGIEFSGLWARDPHRVMALGTLYFGSLFFIKLRKYG